MSYLTDRDPGDETDTPEPHRPTEAEWQDLGRPDDTQYFTYEELMAVLRRIGPCGRCHESP
jgi:hypothetical protein